MFKELGGKGMQRILKIYERGVFADYPVLSGNYEIVGRLNNFERAVFTYKAELVGLQLAVAEKLRITALESVRQRLDDELFALFQKENLITQFLSFLVVDRLDLWKRRGDVVGVNNGKEVVILGNIPKPPMPVIEEVHVNSFDELPDEVQEALRRMASMVPGHNKVDISKLGMLFSKD